MSFLYSRESDRFGEGVGGSDSELARVYGTGESKSTQARRRGGAEKPPTDPKEYASISVDAFAQTLHDEKVDVDRLLSSYNHAPKPQNPLYSTTQNEFGIKKPTAATYTVERLARDQKFSNSYNSQMPRDQGLDCGMTKSTVHKELDPSFV